MNALQQVTAREGRPIIICEKGDKETQSFASRSLEVPHTVDCLQVSHCNSGFKLFNLHCNSHSDRCVVCSTVQVLENENMLPYRIICSVIHILHSFL
jgi:hypothetical protein